MTNAQGFEQGLDTATHRRKANEVQIIGGGKALHEKSTFNLADPFDLDDEPCPVGVISTQGVK